MRVIRDITRKFISTGACGLGASCYCMDSRRMLLSQSVVSIVFMKRARNIATSVDEMDIAGEVVYRRKKCLELNILILF